MDKYRVVVFAQMECSAHARRFRCASQTRLKSCASWKISDSGVWSRQNAASRRKVIMESMEDMKVLVELSCNVGERLEGPLMDADVSSRWALGRLCNGPDCSPSASVAFRFRSREKRAHKANGPQGQISSTGSKRSKSFPDQINSKNSPTMGATSSSQNLSFRNSPEYRKGGFLARGMPSPAPRFAADRLQLRPQSWPCCQLNSAAGQAPEGGARI
jgi:hypothetical protein